MSVNPAGGSGAEQGRDGWCTPRWLAELIGPMDLDPCGNERSHIHAEWTCIVNWGGDGLDEHNGRGAFEWAHPIHHDGRAFPDNGGTITAGADETWKVFVNPPYAHGEVIRWVRHYRHTRFVFLLRWDPSTAWFQELLPACTHVWFPRRRINFEPPPGVKSSSNPFPHALYLRDPPEDMLARLGAHGVLLSVTA